MRSLMRGPVSRFLFLGALAVFWSPSSLPAWDWPVTEPIIAMSFAQAGGGDYSRRLELGSEEPTVSAAHPGEVVLRRTAERAFHAPPGVLGNLLVLDHGQGFRSIYAHLGELTVPPSESELAEGDLLGLLGGSGFSSGEFLGFYVSDRELSSFVNPLVLLPERQDTRPPVIGDLFVETQEGRQLVTSELVVSPGQVAFYAEVYDPNPTSPFPAPLTPYSIRAFVDGRQVFDLTLESIQIRDGRLMAGSDFVLPQPPRPGQELPMGQATLLTGTSVVEIVAEDYAGNRSVRSVEIQVRTTP